MTQSTSTDCPSAEKGTITNTHPISTTYPTTTAYEHSSSSLADHTMQTSAALSQSTTTPSTAHLKTKDQIQTIINNSPELRSSLFSLLQSTIAAAESTQPSLLQLRDQNAKIEDLKSQLLESLQFRNSRLKEIETLEAKLKIATDTGLEQIDHLEDQQRELERTMEVEQNLRRGNMALSKSLSNAKDDNERLKRAVKEQSFEIRELIERMEGKERIIKSLGERVRVAEQMERRMKGEKERLERENLELIVRGEEMSCKLRDVAEGWHEPVGIGGQEIRKRGGMGEEERERERKFIRRF